MPFNIYLMILLLMEAWKVLYLSIALLDLEEVCILPISIENL